MNIEDIGCLILNGFISDLDVRNYPEPVKINNDISFSEACQYYHDTLQSNMNELQTSYDQLGFTVSAGMDSSTVISFVKPKLKPLTVCLDNKRSDAILSKKLVSSLGLDNHHTISIDDINLESELIQLNSILNVPATQLFLMVFHIVLKYMEKQNINALFTGSGIDFPLMESNYQNLVCIEIATRLRQYDAYKALDIINSSKYPHLHTLIDINEFWKKSLVDLRYETYPTNYFYDMFNEYDLKLLGLNYEPYQLRKQTLNDRVTLEIHTYFARLVEPVTCIMDQFSFDLVNPFRNENIWEWVKTLPFEYRNCLGSGKHLQREAIGPRLPDFIMNKERTMFDPANSWFMSDKIYSQVNYLIDKYLISKDNIIFDYIKYGRMQNALNIYRESRNKKDKLWALINLSIWLNINENNRVL